MRLLSLILTIIFLYQHAMAQSAVPARGIDASWILQQESAGALFSDEQSTNVSALSIFQNKNMNAVRFNIFYNGNWRSTLTQDGTLASARRAYAAGFKIMLVLFYSNEWTSPSQQTKPPSWDNLTFDILKDSVNAYTQRVLREFNRNGVQVEWVQLGNNLNWGMLWPEGQPANNDFSNLSQLISTAHDAVHTVSPATKTVVHLSDGQNQGLYHWFFWGLQQAQARFDMVGMSVYAEPDSWPQINNDCYYNMKYIVEELVRKPVIISEAGMTQSAGDENRKFLRDLWNKNTVFGDSGAGVFFYPAALQGIGNGAFDATRTATPAMNAFLPTDFSPSFVRGADVSWITEMEAAGKKFYNDQGQEQDIFAILKSKGVNAIRLRAWVNPSGSEPWNGTDDLVAKAVRAHAAGMNVMIVFHYSDTWADPGAQTIPAGWLANDPSGLLLRQKISDYTRSVLTRLRTAGVVPAWVQVGNETSDGMLWPFGRPSIRTSAQFNALADYYIAGYNAVKAVSPESKVIIHLANGENFTSAQWMFDGLRQLGVQWDMIGLSIYPAWNEEQRAATWNTIMAQLDASMRGLVTRYQKPIMICEAGMPTEPAADSKSFLQELLRRVEALPSSMGKGVFYWEPQAYANWEGYGKGAFKDNGRPTVALDAFVDANPDVEQSPVNTPDPYCKATGTGTLLGATESYIKSITSTGAVQNISLEQCTGCNGGYVKSDEFVSAYEGSIFQLSMRITRATEVAVWIDWNNNGNLNDAGERIAQYASPSVTSTGYADLSIPILISGAVPAGQYRVRLLARNASLQSLMPDPCTSGPNQSVFDFTLRVQYRYCTPLTTMSQYSINLIQMDRCGAVTSINPIATENGHQYIQLAAPPSFGWGDPVHLSLTGSTGSVITTVWADWNHDFDFDDVGEKVFTGGQRNFAGNPLHYDFYGLIPAFAATGITRMRVQQVDSWLPDTGPCVREAATNTVDFDIQITSAPSTTCLPVIISPTPGSRLDSASPFIVWTSPESLSSASLQIYSQPAPNGPITFYYNNVLPAGAAGVQVNGLPVDGRQLTVRLNYIWQGVATSSQAIYDAYQESCSVSSMFPAEIRFSFVAFNWSNSSSAVSIPLNTSATDYQFVYTNEATTSIQPGAQAGHMFFLEQRISMGDSYRFAARAWVDWDNNRQFDGNEKIFELPNGDNLNRSFLLPITVPPGTAPGKKLVRVRVSPSWAGLPEACGPVSQVTTVDFMINVLGAGGRMQVSDATLPAGREAAERFSIQVFPNPSATGIFTIQITGDSDTRATASLWSAVGTPVASYEFLTGKSVLDIHSLPPGMYILQIHTPHGMQSLKLIRN